MPDMRPVYSSVVDEIGYEDGALFVRWSRGGKISVYEGVPADLAAQVRNAPSIGKALREQIQDAYKHRYDEQEPSQ